MAAGLVVVLGVDPGLASQAWTSPAQASTGSADEESRAQNFESATAALGTRSPAPSRPRFGQSGGGPVIPMHPIDLPSLLPSGAEAVVPLDTTLTPASATAEVGGLAVSITAVDGPAPESIALDVKDQAAAEAAGITGVLFEVADASTTPAPLARSVDVAVSYAGFAGIGGGDWASRVQALWLPKCEPSVRATPDCRATPLATVQDPAAGTVTVTVPLETGSEAVTTTPAGLRSTTVATTTASPAAAGAVAITSGVAGPLGSWSATSLTPSSTWGTSGSTAAFTWSYPMRVPQVPAGPSPLLALSYSSAISDGRIPSSNNQSGLIGEGFDAGTSFIERRYKSCSDDETSAANNIGLSAPDLCWGPENATLSLNGTATELIKQGDTWYPKRDDGTRIQHFASGGAEGEYWVVTTVDGTKYSFGSTNGQGSAWTVPVYGNHPGEPCHVAAFKDSSCSTVWRWNLDRVEDTSANSAAYFYTQETNQYRPFYGTSAVSYIAGGYLTRIEYGSHSTDAAEQIPRPPAKVEFSYGPRCITDLAVNDSWCSSSQTSTDANHWPDTPVDLICAAAATCETYAPTFFNRVRLSKITTFASFESSYQAVDLWTLDQHFVPQGDDAFGLEYATGIHLVLDTITHTGKGSGSEITLPATHLKYTAKKNRIENADTGADALARHRLTTITPESGGRVTVDYTTACNNTAITNPETNNTLCFPVKWHHPRELDPRTDYFTKWVVNTITEAPSATVTGSQSELLTNSLAKVTRYDYANAAWKWVKPNDPMIDEDDRTFSEFRGAAQITTIAGETGTQQTQTVTSYYQGTGATLPTKPAAIPGNATDFDRITGEVFMTRVMNGATPVSDTVTLYDPPVTVATSAADATRKAERIAKTSTHTITYNEAGQLDLQTRIDTEFNAFSQPTNVDDRGDVSISSDNLCTRTTYAHVADPELTEKNLVTLPAAVETVSRSCLVTDPSRPTDVVSASTITYDDSGRPTTTAVIDPDDGLGYIQTTATEYDPRGRITKTTDALGHATTTIYTQSEVGRVTETQVTNPLGHITKTTFDPVLGVPTATTDANNRTTTATYDSLGRLKKVWYPQHPTTGLPSIEYAYEVNDDSTGLNAIITKTISADGTRQHLSSTLYDGLLRPFQTQQDARGTGTGNRGRLVAQTIYDSTGRIVKQTDPWWVENHASTTPETMPDDPVGRTTFEYDDAGRQTAEIFWVHAESNPLHEKWRTVTSYNGRATLQIPPMGGIPTETTVNARGNTVKLKQYHRDPDLNAAATTVAAVRALTGSSTTSYAYDPAGRLTRMVDPGSNAWTYDYDWGGRQIAATDPDSGDTTTTYDRLGRVTTRTNGNGQTLAYTYDALGRTTSLRDVSTTGSERARWTYDNDLNGVLSSSTRIVNGQSYTTRTDAWDAAYRPLETTLELPNTAPFTHLESRFITTKHTYTVDGQAASITYPAIAEADSSTGGNLILGKETVTTVYDAESSMPSWMSGGFGWGTYVAASRFDFDGRPISTDLGNTYGATVTYGYEEGTKRLTSIRLDRERVNGTELDLTYGYDKAANVTSIKDVPTHVFEGLTDQAKAHDNQCFNYDKLSRLEVAWTPKDGVCAQTPSTTAAAGAAAPYVSQYTHDTIGNRTKLIHRIPGVSSTTTTYTHKTNGAGPHAVTAAIISGGAVTEYTYDDAGNRVQSKVGTAAAIQYEWDAEGELTATGDTSFVYDAAGDRIVRTDPHGTTIYAGGQEIRITEDGTVTATRYYTFAGKTVAVRTDRGLGDGVATLVSDHHGTPVAAISNSGNPAQTPVRRLYTDPFGATRGASTADTIPGDAQFLGKNRDMSTGLTQIGARYYDETLGRFVSVDPAMLLDDPQQWNAYSYANGNPATLADPSGLAALGANDWTDVNGATLSSRPKNPEPAAPRPEVEPPTKPSPAPDRLDGGGGRDWPYVAEYDYVIDDWLGAGLDGQTPETIMDVFKKYPSEVFPFAVGGCDEFTHGGRCELIEAVPFIPDGTGWVDVTTTPTSVHFAVDDDEYFDGRGSTIEFSVVETGEGLVLRREAHAFDANLAASAAVSAGLVKVPWAVQAANLRAAVLKYSGGE